MNQYLKNRLFDLIINDMLDWNGDAHLLERLQNIGIDAEDIQEVFQELYNGLEEYNEAKEELEG